MVIHPLGVLWFLNFVFYDSQMPKPYILNYVIIHQMHVCTNNCIVVMIPNSSVDILEQFCVILRPMPVWQVLLFRLASRACLCIVMIGVYSDEGLVCWMSRRPMGIMLIQLRRYRQKSLLLICISCIIHVWTYSYVGIRCNSDNPQEPGTWIDMV